MFVKFILGFILSAFFIYFILNDIDISKLYQSLLYTSVIEIILVIFIMSSFYFIRAYRWKLLLDKKIPYSDIFFASSLSYFFSLILIFQAGELSKIHFLKKKYNIDRGYTASTIIIERMLDVSALVVFLLVSLIFFSLENNYVFYLVSILGIIFLFFLVFSKQFLFVVRGTFIHRKIYGFLIKIKLGKYLIELYRSLNDAFTLLHINRVKMTIYTIALWLVNFGSIFVFLGRHGNFFEILGGFSILSLGVAAQTTPANIGQYEFIWSEVFKNVISLPIEQLISKGIVLHAIIIIIISSYALISWLIMRYR